MKATDLATQAYQEYLRLNGGGYTEEEADQLTADFQAVMEGIGHDPHLQTITSWTHGGGNDFLVIFFDLMRGLYFNHHDSFIFYLTS